MSSEVCSPPPLVSGRGISSRRETFGEESSLFTFLKTGAHFHDLTSFLFSIYISYQDQSPEIMVNIKHVVVRETRVMITFLQMSLYVRHCAKYFSTYGLSLNFHKNPVIQILLLS